MEQWTVPKVVVLVHFRRATASAVMLLGLVLATVAAAELPVEVLEPVGRGQAMRFVLQVVPAHILSEVLYMVRALDSGATALASLALRSHREPLYTKRLLLSSDVDA